MLLRFKVAEVSVAIPDTLDYRDLAISVPLADVDHARIESNAGISDQERIGSVRGSGSGIGNRRTIERRRSYANVLVVFALSERHHGVEPVVSTAEIEKNCYPVCASARGSRRQKTTDRTKLTRRQLARCDSANQTDELTASKRLSLGQAIKCLFGVEM